VLGVVGVELRGYFAGEERYNADVQRFEFEGQDGVELV
jgi:hypothetical protein